MSQPSNPSEVPPPPRAARHRKVAFAVFLLALALVAVGSATKAKIYEAGTDDFGIQAFTRVSDRQMVIDSTFGGIARAGGKLVSTYDRSAPAGKRACPT